MSIDLLVQRGTGLKRGEDIESPLLTETSIALELGRNILDKNSKHTSVVLGAIYRPLVHPGELCEVHDAAQGVSWKGKITGVSISKANPSSSVVLSLKLEKPA
jgi:hypothetical protein